LNTKPRAMHAERAIHAIPASQASGCVSVPVTALVPLMTTVNKMASKKTPAAVAMMTCFRPQLLAAAPCALN
jgi:hypothetical protein